MSACLLNRVYSIGQNVTVDGRTSSYRIENMWVKQQGEEESTHTRTQKTCAINYNANEVIKFVCQLQMNPIGQVVVAFCEVLKPLSLSAPPIMSLEVPHTQCGGKEIVERSENEK